MTGSSGTGKWIAIAIVAALLSASVAGGGVYAYQRSAIDRLSADLAAAEKARAGSDLLTADLTSKVDALNTDLAKAKADAANNRASTQGAASEATTSAKSTGSSSQLAYVKSAVIKLDGSYALTADYVELLTGQAAVDAHKADGLGPIEGEQFYIRNQNPALRTLPTSSDVVVYLLGWKGGDSSVKSQVKWSDFKSALASDPYKSAPYTLTLKSGTIVRVEQFYTP